MLTTVPPHTAPPSAFEGSFPILSRDYHGKLLSDIRRVAQVAGVPPSAVWTRLSDYCEKGKDYEWVKNLRVNEDAGLVYVGGNSTTVEDKMRAIVGACLRNYKDARMMSVQEVVRLLKKDELPAPTLLLIPNFCLDKAEGGDVPSWDVSQLMGMLIDRATAGKKTVLFLSSWAVLEKQYGLAFREHFDAYYATMTGKTYKPAITAQAIAA